MEYNYYAQSQYQYPPPQQQTQQPTQSSFSQLPPPPPPANNRQDLYQPQQPFPPPPPPPQQQQQPQQQQPPPLAPVRNHYPPQPQPASPPTRQDSLYQPQQQQSLQQPLLPPHHQHQQQTLAPQQNHYQPQQAHYQPHQVPPPPPLQQQPQRYQQYYQPSHAQPPAERVNVKALPNVAEVVQDELDSQRKKDPELRFTAPATLPPLVNTLESSKLNLILQDAGCARPCHMRSTLYSVPATEDLMNSSGLELSILVKPFDDSEVDGRCYVPLSMSEVTRCRRCEAFVNPFTRNKQCGLCRVSDPIENLAETSPDKPETCFGSYEFRVPAPYYRNQIPESRRTHIIFAIEATSSSRHLVQFISQHLANIIKNDLPTDFLYSEKMTPLVGFVTYNSKITIYDVTNGGHAYVVSDITTVAECAPTSNFLVDPVKNFEAIEKFLTNLPVACSEQLEYEHQTVLGPVIEAALQSCLYDTTNYFQKPNQKVVPTGKMYILHSSLPTYGDETTPGRLSAKRNIDDIKKQLGTDTESKALAPEGKYYAELAKKCYNDYGTGIELFLFPQNIRTFLNISTIGDLAHLTGTGVVNRYCLSSMKSFLRDLKFSLKSTMGFDATMCFRTSIGIRAVKFIGNFSKYDKYLYMPAVNTNSNFVVQLKHEDKGPGDSVVVQLAMIYTSVCGERRLRVHNLALETCQNYEILYKSACCDTLMNAMLRDAIDRMRSSTLTPKTAKEYLISRVISILAGYRKNLAGNEDDGKLVLPDKLKLLPVYLCGALKCDAIDGGPELFPDNKVLAQYNLLGATPSLSQVTVYPRMYYICSSSNDPSTNDANDEQMDCGLQAVLTRCWYTAIEEDYGQCYVLENGYYLFIFFPNTDKGRSFLANVFGAHKDEPDLVWEFRQQCTETEFLENLINQIITERRRTLQINIVRQGIDKRENVFRTFLYEDKKRPGENANLIKPSNRLDNISYVDVLLYVHGEVKSKSAQ